MVLDEMSPVLLENWKILSRNTEAYILNLCVTLGRLLTDCKNAIVSLIFKTGTRYKPENYRPVNPTYVFVQNLDNIFQELFRYLNDERISSEKQQGFRTGYSYLTNLLVARESRCAINDQK